MKCTYCSRKIDLEDKLGYGYMLDESIEWAIREYFHMECMEMFEAVKNV